MGKPRYNKHKCMKCMYHGIGSLGYGVDFSGKRVYCNYAITGSTCLKPGPKGSTIDSRGGDFNECRLYQEGVMIKEDTE